MNVYRLAWLAVKHVLAGRGADDVDVWPAVTGDEDSVSAIVNVVTDESFLLVQEAPRPV